MDHVEWIGRGLASYLNKPRVDRARVATNGPEQLAATLRKGDVLLIEGSSRFSTAVKYLTQSTWSHAALCVSDQANRHHPNHGAGDLLEADILKGVQLVPLSTHQVLHTRICRPVGLTAEEIDAVVDYGISRVGDQYDLKNVIDLARYLVQTPPAPARWKRRLLALGSGDPTRAICSSLIAQAFQSVQYPILPERVLAKSDDPACVNCYQEMLHIRHHSLFTPRDFDISPYFEIVKPTLECGFDPHSLVWMNEQESSGLSVSATDTGPEIA